MSKKILITGSTSKIARYLVKLIPKSVKVTNINSKNFKFDNLSQIKKKHKLL